MAKSRPKARIHNAHSPAPSAEVIDPRWILKALAVTLLIAVFCGYLTLCLLFYQGQWQLVLRPSPDVTRTPAALGLAFDSVSFDVDDTGKPQLTGWYLPAAVQPALTVLYLHGGDATLSATLPRLQQLHSLGFSILAIDYRGYGASSSRHPNQARMTQDAESALTYLINTRNVPAQQVIPCGTGVGASLAATLAANHSDLPALILDDPKADLLPEVAKDPRTHYLPLNLLFHDRFPLAKTLTSLRLPKLLLTSTGAALPMYRAAADPKRISEFPAADAAAFNDAFRRFAGEYLHQPVPTPPPPAAK
jgi:pimeloyl-ACP methyl ester carboxylesterase